MSETRIETVPTDDEPIGPSENSIMARELIDAFLADGDATMNERLMAAFPLAILDLADAFRQGM